MENIENLSFNEQEMRTTLEVVQYIQRHFDDEFSGFNAEILNIREQFNSLPVENISSIEVNKLLYALYPYQSANEDTAESAHVSHLAFWETYGCNYLDIIFTYATAHYIVQADPRALPSEIVKIANNIIKLFNHYLNIDEQLSLIQYEELIKQVLETADKISDQLPKQQGKAMQLQHMIIQQLNKMSHDAQPDPEAQIKLQTRLVFLLQEINLFAFFEKSFEVYKRVLLLLKREDAYDALAVVGYWLGEKSYLDRMFSPEALTKNFEQKRSGLSNNIGSYTLPPNIGITSTSVGNISSLIPMFSSVFQLNESSTIELDDENMEENESQLIGQAEKPPLLWLIKCREYLLKNNPAPLLLQMPNNQNINTLEYSLDVRGTNALLCFKTFTKLLVIAEQLDSTLGTEAREEAVRRGDNSNFMHPSLRG